MNNPLPASIPAEQAALCCMLISADARTYAFERLDASDFSRDTHEKLFTLIKRMHEAQQEISHATVDAAISKVNSADYGGREYLANLYLHEPTGDPIPWHVATVLDMSRRRRVIMAAYKAVAEAKDLDIPDPAANLLQYAQEINENKPADWADMVATANKVLDRLDTGPVTGAIPFGLPKLDEVTGGLGPGPELVIIGARPSNGKTALLNTIAMNAAKMNKRVLYFSQETDAERLLEFMASNRSGIDVWRLKHNLYGIDHEQAEADYAEAVAQIGGYRDLLLINDNFVDLPKLVAKAQNAAQQYSRNCHPVGIVLVDYAQIIEPGHATRDLRTGTVEVVRGLHQLSYRLRVPVVVASQVTTSHKEIDARPRKEHLAESPGALVAAADKIIMVHNPPPAEGVDPAAPRPTTFAVEKHKRGRTGVVHGMFYGTMQRFTEERL